MNSGTSRCLHGNCTLQLQVAVQVVGSDVRQLLANSFVCLAVRKHLSSIADSRSRFVASVSVPVQTSLVVPFLLAMPSYPGHQYDMAIF